MLWRCFNRVTYVVVVGLSFFVCLILVFVQFLGWGLSYVMRGFGQYSKRRIVIHDWDNLVKKRLHTYAIHATCVTACVIHATCVMYKRLWLGQLAIERNTQVISC